MGGSEAAGRSVAKRASLDIVGSIVFGINIKNAEIFFIHFTYDTKSANTHTIEMRKTAKFFHIKASKITALDTPQSGKDFSTRLLGKPSYKFIYLSH